MVLSFFYVDSLMLSLLSIGSLTVHRGAAILARLLILFTLVFGGILVWIQS